MPNAIQKPEVVTRYLELELQVVVSHCMSSGNLILVHWKSSQYSLYLRNSISSPLICFFDTILCKIWAPTSQKMCVVIVFDFT